MLAKAIRNTRFKVRTDMDLFLVIQTETGAHHKLSVIDCSLSGVSCSIDESLSVDLPAGSIVPSSKIIASDNEIPLGRLVFRRQAEGVDKAKYMVAFSLIDTRMPLDTTLSRYLEDTRESVFGVELSNEKFNLSHFVEEEFSSLDLFDKVRKFDVYLNKWMKSNKYGYKTVRMDSSGARINLKRHRKNNRNDYIIMGSNDYLGLASHPEVVSAAQNAMNTYGFGSTGSAVTTGISGLHEELCSELARMHKREDAILFNSGYTANVGVITSIAQANDLLIADSLAHASIQDAMQMSKAGKRLFLHNNIKHLEKILKRSRSEYNGALVITEGVFSMDGDVPPLPDIKKIADKYDCRLMVDQAHCFGVVGPNGLGVCDKYNMLDKVDIIMGTFSKICGGIGGYVVGDRDMIEWLKHFARPYIFSVAIPPSTAAAALQALKIFQKGDLSLRLQNNIKHFISGLKSLGYEGLSDHESSVIPVVIGNEDKLGIMYQSLLDDGIFVTPIVYPAVSRANSRFRFTIMANHSTSELDLAISSLEKAMDKADYNFGE